MSIDHMPPIAIFDHRRRLKGMEYVACSPCHEGTRALDLVASLMSRMYPDSPTPAARAELRKLFQGLANNFPALLKELEPAPDPARLAKYQAAFAGPVKGLSIGPKMHTVMAHFAARAAFALHYELCGEIIPDTGAVFVRWHTNTEFVDRNLDPKFLAALGDPKTLRQGRLSHEDQFEYASLATDTKHLSAHVATFRLSFAVQAFAARDIADLSPAVESPDRVFRPGFLQSPLGINLRA